MSGDQNLPNADRGDKVAADDGVLRNRFARLRQEEQQHIPAFASLWGARTRAPRGKGFWFVAAACVLIFSVAIFLLHLARPKQERVSMASITQWRAPTDFLLETPGREILHMVPEIGTWHGYTAATAAVSGRSHVRKRVLH
ncbi:MAG TPA: hypothetical protein VGQ12_10455 [Candidatus Angelobacter sp.]|jgi:hypothetical protein|nr:hypothetical protein [Candidatus Angelobacter sp.]